MADEERETRARRQAQSPIAPGADPVEPRDPAARAVPRRSSTALLFAIPAVLIVVLGVGWMLLTERDAAEDDDAATTAVEGTSGGNTAADAGTPEDASEVTPPATSDLQILANPEQYAGRTVRFTAVPVVSPGGERTFWAGRPGSRTLVLLDPAMPQRDEVMPGQRVDLAGTIERTPSAAELRKLNLSDEDREALQEAGVFLRATEMEVQKNVAAPRSHTP